MHHQLLTLWAWCWKYVSSCQCDNHQVGFMKVWVGVFLGVARSCLTDTPCAMGLHHATGFCPIHSLWPQLVRSPGYFNNTFEIVSCHRTFTLRSGVTLFLLYPAVSLIPLYFAVWYCLPLSTWHLVFDTIAQLQLHVAVATAAQGKDNSGIFHCCCHHRNQQLAVTPLPVLYAKQCINKDVI